MNKSKADRDFALERYKYVLDQKRELNRTTFSVVAIYQAGLIVVTGGHLSVRSAVAKKELSAVDGAALLDGASWLLVAITAFGVLMVLSGVVTWLGCRRDESEIEAEYLGEARRLPTWRSALAWYETYIILAMILIVVGYFVLVGSLGS